METEKDNKYHLTEDDKPWVNNYLSNNENENVIVSGNGSYKRDPNFSLTKDKVELIQKLSSYNYKTPPFKITNALESLFSECQSNQTHWPYITETYTLRAINGVIRYMRKRYDDWSTLQNAASYFTKTITYHKKKKKFRNTNGSY